MGAMSDIIRDEIDAEMSSLIGADYDALNDAIKDGIITAIANALETHKAEFAPSGGFTGTFTNGDGATVHVVDGIITQVV